jgi:uncharacterized protein (TIGR03382 family)
VLATNAGGDFAFAALVITIVSPNGTTTSGAKKTGCGCSQAHGESGAVMLAILPLFLLAFRRRPKGWTSRNIRLMPR